MKIPLNELPMRGCHKEVFFVCSSLGIPRDSSLVVTRDENIYCLRIQAIK